MFRWKDVDAMVAVVLSVSLTPGAGAVTKSANTVSADMLSFIN